MQLSRRGFLGGLLAVVSTPAIVRVENLMQLAPTEIIRPEPFITRIDILYGSMSIRPEWAVAVDNSLLTVDLITREAVRLFKNSNAFIEKINREYEREFAADNALIGTQLKIRLPSPTHSIE